MHDIGNTTGARTLILYIMYSRGSRRRIGHSFRVYVVYRFCCRTQNLHMPRLSPNPNSGRLTLPYLRYLRIRPKGIIRSWRTSRTFCGDPRMVLIYLFLGDMPRNRKGWDASEAGGVGLHEPGTQLRHQRSKAAEEEPEQRRGCPRLFQILVGQIYL